VIFQVVKIFSGLTWLDIAVCIVKFKCNLILIASLFSQLNIMLFSGLLEYVCIILKLLSVLLK
jgi:hypothetical protein